MSDQQPDENGFYPHRWMMVGYWELNNAEIFESFVSGRALKLGDPHQVDGPGCIECGKHWITGRREPCVPGDAFGESYGEEGQE